MTASIVGMEQESDNPYIQAVKRACLHCTNTYCQGPLPHGAACMRVGRHVFMPPHDMISWKRLSGEGTYSINSGARRD